MESYSKEYQKEHQPASMHDPSITIGYDSASKLSDLIQKAKRATQMSDTKDEHHHSENADQILSNLEKALNISHETNDQQTAYYIHRAALARKEFNAAKSVADQSASALKEDFDIFSRIFQLWQFALNNQDCDLAHELVAIANEMMWWRKKDIARHGEGDFLTQESWRIYKQFWSFLNQSIEDNPDFGIAVDVMHEEEEDQIQEQEEETGEKDDSVPSWLGQHGYEEHTVQWIARIGEYTSSMKGNDSLELRHQSNNFPQSTSYQSKTSGKRIRDFDSCSCGNECLLATLPPIPEEGEDVLTPEELEFKQLDIENEGKLLKTINIIVDSANQYLLSLRAGDRIDHRIYTYAKIIPRLAKGKGRESDGSYVDRDLRSEVEPSLNTLVLELKTYYLTVFGRICQEPDVEVDQAVLKILQELIFWGEKYELAALEKGYGGTILARDEELIADIEEKDDSANNKLSFIEIGKFPAASNVKIDLGSHHAETSKLSLSAIQESRSKWRDMR